MQFTGERYTPEVTGDIRLEHLHRYEWCTAFTADKKVLDIASGEGYGSYTIANNAASVVGVDISDEAIKHAQSKYHDKNNLKFIQGSTSNIPAFDNSVDVVTSFETIEHHAYHDEMMSEIKRVLTEDGLLILSSPNKKIYSDLAGGNHNHFHVKELYFSELKDLLAQYFSNVCFYGQRVTATSLILPFESNIVYSDIGAFSETESGTVKSGPTNIDAMYFLVLASNAKLPPPPNATAFFSEIDNAFYEKQREVLMLSEEIRRMSSYQEEITAVLHQRDNDLLEARRLLAKNSTLSGLGSSILQKILKKLKI